MITEQMLQAAAAEAGQAVCNSLPSPDECVHSFSERFERKMRRVLRRQRHPAAHRFLRRAACFFLILTLGGTSWLAVDVQARTAFLNWVRYQYENVTEYRFAGDASMTLSSVPEPAWLPEGYSEKDRMDAEGYSARVYTNTDGGLISFSCSRGADAASLFLVSDTAAELETQVNGRPADYYQEADSEAASALVWMSADGATMFCLTGALPEETLVRIAESVPAGD